MTDALTKTGHLDAACRLLTERSCPSWLYPVTMGATTIWEKGDPMLHDGNINPGQMTSYNHYALGAAADWMHRVIGGIDPLEPGSGQVLVAPQPWGDTTSANSTLDTPHSLFAVCWTAGDEAVLLTLDLDVPEGVVAVVRRPGVDDVELGAARHAVVGS